MIATLAFRHLLVRKWRSLFLLLGFSLGVGVMIVLLSIGQAMLEQSRDVSLIGGGEVTILPQGIDVEAMRTGGVSAMFFGIDRARFIARQAVGGPRHRELVRTVSPAIEDELVYLRHGDRVVAVRAGGDIPSRAATLGSGLDLLSGTWDDSPADSQYISPTPQQLYDELDRFHLPARPDSTWAEWHYFNLVASEEEWWYVTYLIGGEVELRSGASADRPEGRPRWGGQLLITRRRPDGTYQRFTDQFPPGAIEFDTARADLVIGPSSVRQRNGSYRLHAVVTGEGGPVTIDVTVNPAAYRYFPPVELGGQDFVSGYVVPALVATASGTICVARRCRELKAAPAYHDHNWGVWRDVTWEWGTARGERISLLYGGVYGPAAIRSPFFLAAVDSLGLKQVLRFDKVAYRGSRKAAGTVPGRAPGEFRLVAARETDSLRLQVNLTDALGTEVAGSDSVRVFFQMRGRFRLDGRLLGEAVSDSGMGFFETYSRR